MKLLHLTLGVTLALTQVASAGNPPQSQQSASAALQALNAALAQSGPLPDDAGLGSPPAPALLGQVAPVTAVHVGTGGCPALDLTPQALAQLTALIGNGNGLCAHHEQGALRITIEREGQAPLTVRLSSDHAPCTPKTRQLFRLLRQFLVCQAQPEDSLVLPPAPATVPGGASTTFGGGIQDVLAGVTPCEQELYVISSALNVRRGPGTEYARIGSLRYGQHVEATGRARNGWYRIIFLGQRAWISGGEQYVATSAPGPAHQQAKPYSSERLRETVSELKSSNTPRRRAAIQEIDYLLATNPRQLLKLVAIDDVDLGPATPMNALDVLSDEAERQADVRLCFLKVLTSYPDPRAPEFVRIVRLAKSSTDVSIQSAAIQAWKRAR